MKHGSSSHKNKAYAKALRSGGQNPNTPYMDKVPAKRGKKYGGSGAIGTGAAGGAGGG